MDIRNPHGSDNVGVLALKRRIRDDRAMNETIHPAGRIQSLFTAVTPVIWGSTYLLTTQVLPQGIPLTTAAIRSLPAGILLLLAARTFRPGLPWRRIALLSLLNISGFQAFLFLAAQRLPGGIAALVGSLQPIILIFLVWWINGSRPRLFTIGAALFGLVGVWMVFAAPGARYDVPGVLAGFAGALCMSLGTFLSVRWRSDMAPVPFIGWQLALGGLFLLGPALLLEGSLPVLTFHQWVGYAYLILPGTAVAYAIWFRGLAMLPPLAVSTLGLLSPVTAVLLGWGFLGQALQPTQIAGIAAVLASILVLQASPHPSRARPAGT